MAEELRTFHEIVAIPARDEAITAEEDRVLFLSFEEERGQSDVDVGVGSSHRGEFHLLSCGCGTFGFDLLGDAITHLAGTGLSWLDPQHKLLLHLNILHLDLIVLGVIPVSQLDRIIFFKSSLPQLLCLRKWL